MLVFPLHATPPTEDASDLAQLVNETNDQAFLRRFGALDEERREEARHFFTVDIPSWTALRSAPRAFFEKAKEEYPQEIRQTLVDWLKRDLSSGENTDELDALRYVSLSEYPVHSKIKFEKSRCAARAPAATPVDAGWFCSLRQHWSRWRCAVPPVAQESAPSSCDTVLTVTVAMDLLGEKGIYEETLVKSSVSEFITSFTQARAWPELRKKLWLSLERLYTKLPRYADTLAARLRVAELANAAVDEKAFFRKKELIGAFGRKNLIDAVLRAPAQAQVVAPVAGPRSEWVQKVLPAAKPAIRTNSRDYGAKTYALLRASWRALERNSSPLLQKDPIFAKRWRAFSLAQATSPMLAAFAARWSDAGAVNLASEVDDFWPTILKLAPAARQSEQQRITQLNEIFRALREECRQTLPMSQDERLLFETLEKQGRLVEAMADGFLKHRPASLHKREE